MLVNATIFDPATGRCDETGALNVARNAATATTLNDGRVLVVGGETTLPGGLLGVVASSELYDSARASFAPAANMTAARELHTATLLSDGTVLIAGGEGHFGDALKTAEIYDPAAGVFRPTGDLVFAVYKHTATLLDDGKVLIAGGEDATGYATDETQVYDPSKRRFYAAGKLSSVRKDHTATKLRDGEVLIAGGEDNWGHTLSSTDLYNPRTGEFRPTAGMKSPHEDHGASLLGDGRCWSRAASTQPAASRRSLNYTIRSPEPLFAPAT